MKKVIEFEKSITPYTGATLSTVGKPASKYEDLILKPEFEARKFQFPAGATWFRLVPPLRGSKGFMLRINAVGHPGGRHAKSITGGKSVFSIAYDWLLKHHPELLFRKENPEGFRLLSSPVAAYWMLVEEDGKMVARILLANAYDGSRNGTEGGLGHRLLRLVQERDEALGLISDPLDPVTGVQVGIEKTQPMGVKYPSYTLRLGRQPAPIDRFLERMDGDELDALCPLEETVRSIEPEYAWELLGNVVGMALRDKIRAAAPVRP
ncbi:MAG: hypothetical protein RLZZ398_218 [Verrucomicrobiota bacterium]|jgi:hypothetical protein